MPPNQPRIRVLVPTTTEATWGNSFAVVLECSRKREIEEMDVIDAVLEGRS
jgi:hypothetical protein